MLYNIYKIISPLTKKVYIGSTKYSLVHRLSQHQSEYKLWLLSPLTRKYITSFEILFYRDYEIELICSRDCIDPTEAHALEGKYQLENVDCIVNYNISTKRPRNVWMSQNNNYICNCGIILQNKYKTKWNHFRSNQHKQRLIEKHIVEDVLTELIVDALLE